MQKIISYIVAFAMAITLIAPAMTSSVDATEPETIEVEVSEWSELEDEINKHEDCKKIIKYTGPDVVIDEASEIININNEYNNTVLDLGGKTIECKYVLNSYREAKGAINIENGFFQLKNGKIIASTTGSEAKEYAYALTAYGNLAYVGIDGAELKSTGTNNSGAVIQLNNGARLTIRDGIISSNGGSTETELIEAFGAGEAEGEITLSGGKFFNDASPTVIHKDSTANYSCGMTGGTYNQEPGGITASDGYELEKSSDNKWVVTYKDFYVDSEWKGVNNTEKRSISAYNWYLATNGDKTEIVYEINSQNASNNAMYKTIYNTVKDEDYSYKFEYTIRTTAGTTKAENSFEVYLVPGKDNTAITTAGTVKVGMYYGYDNAWTTAHGMFKGVGGDMTIVLKPVKSSGLGGIIRTDSVIEENSYDINDNKAIDLATNAVENGTFEGNDGWTANGKLEIGETGTYADAFNDSYSVLEINGDKGLTNGVVYQTLNKDFESGDKITYKFDVFSRIGDSTDADNTINVYAVPGTSIDGYKTKGMRIGTVLGSKSYWQSTECSFIVPENFGTELTFVLETEDGMSGAGGIVDNVSVEIDDFEPVVEKVTDTTITVTKIEGVKYTITDGTTTIGPQDSNIFTGLAPGTEYTIKVSKHSGSGGASIKTITGVTSKKEAGVAKDPEAAGKTSTSITINTVEGQEYSIDGGKTWIEGTGNPYTFTGLESGKEYTVMTRIPETFDTMGSETKEIKVTTEKAAAVKPGDGSAETSDNTDLAGYLAILLASAGIGAFAVVSRRRKNENRG